MMLRVVNRSLDEQRAADVQPSQSSRGDTGLHGSGILRLLDREPPSSYVSECTERIARVEQATASGSKSATIFRIGMEWFAFPTSIIHEVAEAQIAHSLPRRRKESLIGLVSVRGELLICVALAGLLHLDISMGQDRDSDLVSRKRLLIIGGDATRLALLVDEVSGIHRYDPQELVEVPTTLTQTAVKYTLGLLPWKEKLVACLDDELLLLAVDKSLS
jgi:chemotaxis-related protein WspD